MIPLRHLSGRGLGVLGLGRSGLATAKAARAGGADVFAWDDGEAGRHKARAEGFDLVPPQDWPWRAIAAVSMAPGIPLTHPAPHPMVAMADEAGAEVICDVELLFRETRGRARFLAVTGTNGKSTTTALLGHVLTECGLATSVGGNIGRAALDLEAPDGAEAGEGRVYVLELSSYQLDLTRRFRPDVAVWLNLTPDHLDRHGGMDGYRRAKERIFANMGEGDTLVLGIDEAEMRSVASRVSGLRVATVSVEGRDAAFHVDDAGMLFEGENRIADISRLAGLRGRHNWQNAACAFAAARALDIDDAAILEAMETFPGLAHRMEPLGYRGAVLFVNDSKATNADAAERSLSTYTSIYWIAGGLGKEGGIEPLAPLFGRVARAYLVGRDAEAFAATLKSHGVDHEIAGTMDVAVAHAARDAARDSAGEPTVLLAPAAASFDQFADFEARGEAFRAAVAALGTNAQEERVRA